MKYSVIFAANLCLSIFISSSDIFNFVFMNVVILLYFILLSGNELPGEEGKAATEEDAGKTSGTPPLASPTAPPVEPSAPLE